MLKFNLERVMRLRGIEQIYRYLFNNGFTYDVAYKLGINKVAAIKVSHIGKLCRLLHCTPNDLFEWIPVASDPLPDNHPLNQLVKEEIPLNVRNLLKDIPLDKMSEVENLLKGLKNK